MNVTELITRVGELSHDSRELYKQYKLIKEQEDAVRAELTATLNESGLLSAKTDHYTASISKKQSVVVVDEKKAVDWIKSEGLDVDYYVGLKLTPFKTMALSRLKDTGEVIEGTQLTETDTLSIREAKKKPLANDIQS